MGRVNEQMAAVNGGKCLSLSPAHNNNSSTSVCVNDSVSSIDQSYLRKYQPRRSLKLVISSSTVKNC